MSEPLTAVVFRTFKQGGDVLALFPLEPGTNNPADCLSYQRIGQHGAASPELTRDGSTRPSTPEEICDLACELRGLGYKLRGLNRIPRNAYQVRKSKLEKLIHT